MLWGIVEVENPHVVVVVLLTAAEVANVPIEVASTAAWDDPDL
jgi:hypothetical protein